MKLTSDFSCRLVFSAGKAGLLALFIAALGIVPVWAQQYSHARVVRLSFVEGTVTVQRPDADEWATAPVNTPIQEGFKLSTAENSFAEVEFENAASTARLGQLSLLEFNQLALAADGGKLNRLTLTQGYATFHFVPSEQDVYEVKAGDATLTPSGKAEFRADLDDSQLRVEVFKGSVDVSGSEGSQTLTKSMVFDMRPGEAAEVTQGVTKDAWDEWVAQRDETQTVAQAPAATGPSSGWVSSGFYGSSDLYGYGDWGYVPGYGNAWFPQVPLGWAPYSVGRWAWYPGFGYTWISAEPWGWLPFHYGNWLFDPGYGWFWMPGAFGYWSPGIVTWYQGPGWVGWAPQVPLGNRHVTTPVNCPQGRTCMTVVSTEVVRGGKPVSAQNTLAVDLAEARGRRVASPDIPPTRLSMLPGAPVSRPGAFLGAQGRTAGSLPEGTPHILVGKAPAHVTLRESESASRPGAFSGRATASPSGSADRSSGVHPGRFGGSQSGPRSSSASSGGARSSSGSGGSSGGGSQSAPRSSSGSSGGARSSSGGGGGFSGGGGGHASSGGGSSGGSTGGGGGHSHR